METPSPLVNNVHQLTLAYCISVNTVLNISTNWANLEPFKWSSHAQFRTNWKLGMVSSVHVTNKSLKMPWNYKMAYIYIYIYIYIQENKKH